MKYVMYESFVYEVNGTSVRKVNADEATQMQVVITPFDNLNGGQQEAVMKLHHGV